MDYKEIDELLAKKQMIRRIAAASVAVVSFVLLIYAIVMRLESREVIINDYGFFQSEQVIYNNDWYIMIVPCILAFFYSFVFLVVDMALCRIKSFEKDGQHITVYRGMLRSAVYVDGSEVGAIEPISFEHVIETRLKSGVKVVFSFPTRKSLLFSYIYVSFSDNTSSFEI